MPDVCRLVRVAGPVLLAELHGDAQSDSRRRVQKGAPLLPSWLLCANVPQVLLNGALADAQAQLQEFSANPLSTPKPLVLRHPRAVFAARRRCRER